MKRILTFGLIWFYFCGFANGLTISNVVLNGNTLSFDILWDNSWRYGANHNDAVWLFAKQAPNGGSLWEHCFVSAATTATSFYEIIQPADKVGIFVQRKNSGDFQGTSKVAVSMTFDNLVGGFQDIKVFGIEMVYIPQGAFVVGDGFSENSIRPGDFSLIRQSVPINSEGGLSCGTGATDILYGFSNVVQCYFLPASYPKGFAPFYIMKYHITQGQYVDFLNCLYRNQQNQLVNASISGTTVDHVYVMCDSTISVNNNVIRCNNNIGKGNITFYCDRDNDGIPNEAADGSSRACNFFKGDYIHAYLDWSGLRPMSFLEYEKACRGPLSAVPYERSWGSALENAPAASGNVVQIQDIGTISEKYTNSGVDGGILTDVNVIRVGFNAPTTGASRELSNASYYGVIDLGNNPGDFYIDQSKVGFEAKHGDGSINNFGKSDVTTWPVNSDTGGIPVKYRSVSALGYTPLTGSARIGARGVRSL